MSPPLGTFAVAFLCATAVGLVASRLTERISPVHALLIAACATIGIAIGTVLR